MSKKSGRRSADTIVNANPIPGLLRPPVPRPLVTPSPYLVRVDERVYSPLRLLQPLGPGGGPSRLTTRRTGNFRRSPIQFASAAAVDICRKRKDRREVIFAKGKAGKGAKARFRKQHQFSKVSCK